jgi:pectate lyase
MKTAGYERDITYSRQTARPLDNTEAKSFFTSTRKSVRRGLLGAAMLLGAVATSIAQTIAVPDGYATQNGGTTGGGNASPVTVSTASAFQSAVSGSTPAVVVVNGRLNVGNVTIGSNKTVVGANNSSGLYGGTIRLTGTNYIIQNLTIGPASGDTFEISGARNVFITKCEFYGSTDELCSIVRAADFVTVSWSKFHFPNSDSHSFAHLIGNADDATGDR